MEHTFFFRGRVYFSRLVDLVVVSPTMRTHAKDDSLNVTRYISLFLEIKIVSERRVN